MLSLNVRTPVHENNHTSHRVQDPSLIRISQHTVSLSLPVRYNKEVRSCSSRWVASPGVRVATSSSELSSESCGIG